MIRATRRLLMHRFVRSPAAMFVLLALAVMGPLLAPGRILTLDSLLALNWDITGFFWGTSNGYASVFAPTYASAPVALVLKGLGAVLPASVLEKLWLFLIFWLAGFGASRLPHLRGGERYYAGLLYAVNPFSYSRFVAGQWGVLGAYALVPFAVTSFIHLLTEPRPRHAVTTALLLTLIGMLQVHGLLLTLLVLGVLYLGRLIGVRKSALASFRMLVLGLLIFFGINLFWLVRYGLSGGWQFGDMPVGELTYYAAGSPLHVLSLRGFWLSAHYIDIADLIPVWWLLFFPLLFLAVYGAARMLDRRGLRWLAWSLMGVAILGLFLAAGPRLPITEPAFTWLWERVPPYRVFRDSQKFVGLLALAYAYLGAYGLRSILGGMRRARFRVDRRLVVSLAAGMAILYALPIFGTWGQLQPTDFPTDWHTVRAVLDEDTDDYNVLVLPWHMYMAFAWLPNHSKTLANPAPTFFTQPTISGDNWEVPPSYSDSSNPVSEYVETLLEHVESMEEFGRLIGPLNARYVVLFKAADYESYGFLRRQQDLELAYEGETIALFRNTSPTVRAYNAASAVSVNSLDNYFRLFGQDDPLGRLYLLDPFEVAPSVGGVRAGREPFGVSIVRNSPVSYDVVSRANGYLVFTLPQRAARGGWTYRGESGGLLNLGMMPAFEVHEGGGNVRFAWFYRMYVPLYVLAVISLLGGAFIIRRWR